MDFFWIRRIDLLSFVLFGAKFDIKKFDETGDLGLWRVKICAILIQHGCEAALEVLPADMKAEAKAELNKKAHSEALTLKDVMAILNLKKIRERSKANGYNGEGLYVRGTTNRKDSHQSRGNSRSKSQGGLEVMMVMSVDPLLEWIMDSEGSYHMTYVLDLFFDFLECDRARYIPELKRNLISLGTLEKKVYTITLQSGEVKVINGSIVVLSGSRRDNCVYSLDGHAVAGELNASVEEKHSRAQVWHKRLGHISEVGLQMLKKQELFGKKSLCKLDFYENCVLGKLHRVSFSVGRNTTQRVIDYVHSDLWGPSQVESLGGKRYFLSIVNDNLGGYEFIFSSSNMKHFGKFKEWKYGIARHLTIVGTLPQENGLADQMNRTLMDKIHNSDPPGSSGVSNTSQEELSDKILKLSYNIKLSISHGFFVFPLVCLTTFMRKDGVIESRIFDEINMYETLSPPSCASERLSSACTADDFDTTGEVPLSYSLKIGTI
ncbi:retrovirus-related pol polyprotein from transposon TNT 1-94 [Tanacetum coccineum]